MCAVSVYLGPQGPGQFSVDDGNGFGGRVDFSEKRGKDLGSDVLAQNSNDHVMPVVVMAALFQCGGGEPGLGGLRAVPHLV